MRVRYENWVNGLIGDWNITRQRYFGVPFPAWYPIDAKTRIMRGKMVVTFEQAKIVVGERVVAIVDHESDSKMRTLEIRLSEGKGK